MVGYQTISASLCETLVELAWRTWRAIGVGRVGGIAWSEPTITEVNLLDLQLRHPSNITVWKFSAWEESTKTGADWEWWIGRPGRWFGLRVQAKKIHHSGSGYRKLDHTSRSGRQVDLLIKNASPTCYPIFCFYNFWNPPLSTLPWNCPGFHPDERLLGCSIADGFAVQKLIYSKRNRLSDILPISLPWSCLACCQGWISYGGSLEERVRSVISHLPERTDQPIPQFQNSLPEYAERIRRGDQEIPEAPDIPFVVVLSLEEEQQLRQIG